MSCIFFFNDTATTEIYTLSLHDALPISPARTRPNCQTPMPSAGSSAFASLLRTDHAMIAAAVMHTNQASRIDRRSEEHTSELQSHLNLVCRLLLEKKKKHIVRSEARVYL